MPFDDQGYNLKIGNEIIERIGFTCKDKYFKFVCWCKIWRIFEL